jgi:hypothetical protein
MTCTLYTFLWPGHGINHPPPSSADVKERINLYFYFPSRPLWPVLGSTFALLLCETDSWQCAQCFQFGDQTAELLVVRWVMQHKDCKCEMCVLVLV